MNGTAQDIDALIAYNNQLDRELIATLRQYSEIRQGQIRSFQTLMRIDPAVPNPQINNLGDEGVHEWGPENLDHLYQDAWDLLGEFPGPFFERAAPVIDITEDGEAEPVITPVLSPEPNVQMAVVPGIAQGNQNYQINVMELNRPEVNIFAESPEEEGNNQLNHSPDDSIENEPMVLRPGARDARRSQRGLRPASKTRGGKDLV